MEQINRAATIGNVASFKELMQQNEEYGYDYKQLYKQFKNVDP